MPKLCEGLADFHYLNAVGIWRGDARHGDGEDFHGLKYQMIFF